MKTKRWIAAVLMTQFVITFLSTETVQAQTKVALCDVGMIFKNHPEFSQKLAALKLEADQFKANATNIQQQLMQKAEVLQQYEPGSAEFNQAETKLAQESAAIEVEQRDAMRKLMQREAQLHYDTYDEVTKIISDYCQEQGIQLVLRFNSEDEGADNPQAIMQKVNGNVVYHRNQNNITATIIQRIAQLKGSASRGQATQR